MALEDLVQDIEHALRVYERLIAGTAARTRSMLERHGPVETLRRLVEDGRLQSGFKVLRDEKQLRESFEQLVVTHSELFEKETVKAAQWRLDHPHSLA